MTARPSLPPFRIYYGSGAVVRGCDLATWLAAPGDDVQVVVAERPYPEVDGLPYRPWSGITQWQVWTGDDVFDPFGTGAPKRGRWMTWAAYMAIWERVRADHDAAGVE
jgi:hypothetical protein